MKKIIVASLFFLAVYMTNPLLLAQGRNTIEANSKIDRVMVYHDRALVTRVVRLEKVAAGTNEIIFPNLPMMLQDDSVRAKIVEGGDAKILDVEVKTVLLEKAPELKIRQLQEKQQSLMDDKKRLQNRVKVLQYELEYLTESRKHFLESKIPPRGSEREAVAHTKLRIDEYEAMLRYLNEKYQANANAMFKEEINARETDIQIGLVRSELTKLNAGQSMSPNKKMVKVALDAVRAGSYLVELSYINYRVKWKPGYDIRVFVDDNKTEFTGYGVVDQNSGEDWLGALISYSTAQPAISGYLPELLPLYATVSSKLNPGSGARQDIAAQNAANRAELGARSGDGLFSGSDTEAVGPHNDTTAERKAGSMVFNVPRRSDIPSDGSPHRTAISRQTFPVKFEFASVPRLSPHAYLQAIGSNNMNIPILRGDLNIFMGNDFVGSSNTDTIMPGEDFELTLSVNDNIRVTRVLEEKGEEAGGFLSGSQKTNFSFVLKVENYTGKDIVMNVYDQIPVSETEDIEVTNVVYSLKPFKQNKKGILQWHLNMKPKEIVQINFSFSVNVPKGKELAFFRTGLAPTQFIQDQLNKQRSRSGNIMEQKADEYQKEMKVPAMKKR